MQRAIYDEVREGCAWVAERSTHVRIVRERIAAYAGSLPLGRIAQPALDPAHHYLVDVPDETAAFVLTLDTINFGSGYFPQLRKRPGLSGYFTVATSLTERFQTHGPYAAGDLARLNGEDCAYVFGQSLDDPTVAELMDLFARALNDLGTYVGEQWAGSFTALIESAGGSADALIRLLAAMPFYRDVEHYAEREVPFYKRAQLTAADLALALPDHPLGRFDDLDRLTIFADNLVPHVLRVDGVLEYDTALLARIERGELIPAGSPEEVEIRACAVHAVELIAAHLRDQGHVVTSASLDYLLWNRGQEPGYKAVPRHRTRTVYY
jgi:Queuosine salvage protein